MDFLHFESRIGCLLMLIVQVGPNFASMLQ